MKLAEFPKVTPIQLGMVVEKESSCWQTFYSWASISVCSSGTETLGRTNHWKLEIVVAQWLHHFPHMLDGGSVVQSWLDHVIQGQPCGEWAPNIPTRDGKGGEERDGFCLIWCSIAPMSNSEYGTTIIHLTTLSVRGTCMSAVRGEVQYVRS